MKRKGMLLASFFLVLLLIVVGVIWIAQDQNTRYQHDLSMQATETALRNGTQTAVVYAATGTAISQATANAAANAFPTPFIAISIFHEDLSQVNSNWEQSGCDFQDGSYQIAFAQSYYMGCPRSGTSGFNNVAYQIVFRDMQSHGDGGVGIVYNVQEKGVVSAGDMFLIDKEG